MRTSISSIVGTVALAQISLGCFEPSPSIETDRAAITSGSYDFSFPSVVAVMVDDRAVCTGTLIAPDQVLTAAHCAQADLDGAWIAVGLDTARPTDAAPITGVIPHPRFDSIHSDADAAVLQLSRLLDGLPVIAIATEPPAVGAIVQLVGYGRNEVLQPAGARQRLSGTVRIDEVEHGTLVTAPGPSQSCNGDSGGPALVVGDDGVARIVGVVSQADQSCTGWGRLARTDVLRSGFLDAFAATTPLALGARCFLDDQCNTGQCWPAPDEPLTRVCTTPCATDGSCPVGGHCDARGETPICVLDGPSPGAAGASCATRFDCAIGLCTIDQNGATACGQPCGDDSDCGQGETCAPSTDGPTACTGELADHGGSGGCNSSGRGGGANLGAIAFVLAAFAARLRNRTGRR